MGEMTTTTTTKPGEPRPLGDEEARDLIKNYKHLVFKIAHRLHQNLPEQIDIDDLIGWGYAGLMEAYHRYDEDKTSKFATYAYYRIRGAMLDACPREALDPHRRVAEMASNEVLNIYAHVVQTQRSQAFLEDRLSAMSDVAGSMMMICVLRECPSRALRAEGAPHHKELVRNQTIERVQEYLQGMPEKEREVLKQIYFEEKSMTEIAQERGCSTSWVSRTHSRALDRIRKRMCQKNEDQMLRHSLPV